MKFTIKNRWNGSEIYSGEGADLREVVINAVKSGAYLTGANLSGADLYGANLSGADLTGAILYGANLYGANLTGANLSGANLKGADLYGANLSGANLTGANLSRADLSGADLTGANLTNAILYGANLTGAKDFPAHLFRICPEGAIIGWKKLACGNILKLTIPMEAKRCNAVGSRKCRAEFAWVTALYNSDREPINSDKPLISKHESDFTYEIGKKVTPDKYDDSITEECSSGIHFFTTFEEARDY